MLNSPVLDTEPSPKVLQKPKSASIRKKLRALDTLLDGDPNEQRETFKHLKKALNKNRGSERKLFS